MHYGLEQEVPEFFFQRVGIVAIDGFDNLVRFLDQAGLEALVCLRSIPRAAAWPEQPIHDSDKVVHRPTPGGDEDRAAFQAIGRDWLMMRGIEATVAWIGVIPGLGERRVWRNTIVEPGKSDQYLAAVLQVGIDELLVGIGELR